jgi:tetratricopeptide (TPR) repeat protein
MEQENKHNSLVRPSQFKESGIFEDFAKYLLELSPTLFSQLRIGCEHDTTEVTADTSERGRIVELENEAGDLSENNSDEADQWNEAMKMFFKSGNLSMPFEVFTNILRYPLTLFRKPAKVIYKPCKAYDDIRAHLIHLEDNGDFEQFDSYSSEVMEKYREKEDFDIVAGVTLERAQCALYRNDLDTARRLAREAHELAGRTQFPPVFHAQAFLIMSSVSRYRRKLGETKKYLDLAEQSFESGYSIEEFSHFHEVYGSYLDIFLGISPKPDEQVKELALTSFKKMGEIGSQHSKARVNDKKRFYAMIKSARILLDSNSTFGRKQRTVTKHSVHLAAQCLGVIKRDLLGSVPRGTKIQFQLVESDLYFRQGKFEAAVELLKKSLVEAKEFGFKTEGPKITQVGKLL